MRDIHELSCHHRHGHVGNSQECTRNFEHGVDCQREARSVSRNRKHSAIAIGVLSPFE